VETSVKIAGREFQLISQSSRPTKTITFWKLRDRRNVFQFPIGAKHRYQVRGSIFYANAQPGSGDGDCNLWD
jgi:hypothetical protein